MAVRFRQSSQQLALCARQALRTATRPAYRASRLPRASLSSARQLPTSRLYSTQSTEKPEPKKDDDNSSPKPEEKEEDFEPRRPLPPGWVRMEKQDLKDFDAFIQKASAKTGIKIEGQDVILQGIKHYGCPQETRELLKKWISGNITIFEQLRCMKALVMLAKDLGEHEVEYMRRNPSAKSIAKGLNDNTFTSNQPESDRKAQTSAEEQKQQSQGKEAGEKQTGQEGKQSGEQQGQQGPKRPGAQGQGQGQGGQEPPQSGPLDGGLMNYVIGTAVLFWTYKVLFPGNDSREITWQELRKNFLEKGLVEKLTVIKDRVVVDLNKEATRQMYPESAATAPGFHYYFSIGSIDAFERRLDEAQSELGIPPAERIPVSYANEFSWGNVILAFGPTLVLVGLLAYISKRGPGGAGGPVACSVSARARPRCSTTIPRSRSSSRMSLVWMRPRSRLWSSSSSSRSPSASRSSVPRSPRGAILSGPPGTGKTLLAKATAGESQVPFFSVSGSEFVEMFVGVGASRVRDLFATARKNAPCIIFIDEIDAIGRSRSDGGFRGGGNDEREATLNQILTEMDGFNTTEQVVVLAGTNRPDVLDKALMRPGRFDRHINIDRPTMKGRQDIFKVHLAKIVTKEDIEYLTGRLAALTPGFAGADIANVVNEAALVAARASAETVAMTHFEQAIERVIGGLERKSLVLSPEEKRTVAYHEAGHAICGWFFQWADPLLKVSIIPRGQGALGYAQYLPSGDAYLMNTKQLMDRMAMTLGGRVSEEIHFPVVTTGASDDFKKVTNMARAMVTQWGMSEKVGMLHFDDSAERFQKPFAESTAQAIDNEVKRIVDEAYKQCKDLLTAKKKEVGMVAEELLRKEVLSRDDLVRLLGPREWPDKEEFSKYFNGERKGAPPPFPVENTDTPEESGPTPAMKEGEADKAVGNKEGESKETM
ncbi:putative ATP-dependent peptidase [Sordaria macrospora k-hell]|uniref:Putative ATP-dependent peptidase n=1 Tax=Sordaria macrospora (strain ATCC MYA-333 / DSM 997 / K(L3346) / K-hell) TaxID=771870 RepID=F7W6Y1_SORMK|nr:putative ATP-dependent peptidase [Sordaria macrospora k-hell]CCC13271.1 putative ATP-dependent peptidase [Sordaria macrospora k-hell]